MTKSLSDQNIFYVYEHWRPDKGVCFHVGKGKERRAYDFSDRHQHHKNTSARLRKMGLVPEVRIVAVNLSEREAFDEEVQRIAFWNSCGDTLVNKTVGGDGPAGVNLGIKRSAETKAKMSAGKKGKLFTPEHKAKLSAAAKSRLATLEGRQRMLAAVSLSAKDERATALRAEKLRKNWQDPEFRARMMVSIRKSAETLATRRAAKLLLNRKVFS